MAGVLGDNERRQQGNGPRGTEKDGGQQGPKWIEFVIEALGPVDMPPFEYDAAHSGGNRHLHLAMKTSDQIVSFGRLLQEKGFQVSEHPKFGGVGGGHAPDGYHYTGQAIDINTSNDETNSEIQEVVDLLGGESGVDGAPGDSSGAGGLGSFTEEDLFAIGRASAISTQLELPGLLNMAESIWMKGAKSIYNDEPLMPFVEQLCKASLRQFQSLPNGAFFAFFPDQFGMYRHRKPYWNIDNIEIIDGGIELNDEALATHVFVVGDTNLSGDVELSEKVASKGVITIYDAFTSDFMLAGRDNHERKKKDKKNADKDKLADHLEARQFLRKYGVRPHYEEAPFIRNSFFEIFYAYTQFQLLWSNQFRTSFQFTFMPELYPGGIVAFEDHGIQCYIDSVTHSFDYESGFTTQANLSSPAAIGGKSSPISQGMVRPFDKKNFNGHGDRNRSKT